MKARSAKKTFLNHLGESGRLLASVSLAEGVQAMLDFYSAERADDCSVDEDGDMLLFQWGIHDWGGGESFEFNVTRQFILGRGDDDDIRQLSLTFEFRPSPAFRDLGEGNRWCSSPAGLPKLRGFLLTSPAYGAVKKLRPVKVSLDFKGV